MRRFSYRNMRATAHLLNDEVGTPYAQIAAELNMSLAAVKVTVHRLRRRYGEVLRDEVAQTLPYRRMSPQNCAI